MKPNDGEGGGGGVGGSETVRNVHRKTVSDYLISEQIETKVTFPSHGNMPLR